MILSALDLAKHKTQSSPTLHDLVNLIVGYHLYNPELCQHNTYIRGGVELMSFCILIASIHLGNVMQRFIMMMVPVWREKRGVGHDGDLWRQRLEKAR